MPYVEIAGDRVFYAARGDDSNRSQAPLLFVHGAGDSHLEWNGQLAAFASTRRTIALDLPGHGRSTGKERARGNGLASIVTYTNVVCEFLDALDIVRAIVVGISMGGAIAQTLALDHPERVRALGLVGTGAKLRVDPRFLNGMQTDFEAAARVLVENFYAVQPSSPAPLRIGEASERREGSDNVQWGEMLRAKSVEQLLTTGRDVTYADFAACDAFDVRARIASISAPTLVLCGREDKMTPVKYSEYIAQHIPGARLELIENAGHMVMVERPSAFNLALRDWLTAL